MVEIPVAKSYEIARDIRLVGLLEKPDGAVLGEKPDVGREHAVIGVGYGVVFKARHVVPYRKIVCQFSPFDNVVCEAEILVGFERVGEVAFDGAKLNPYVFARSYSLGRGTGILIRERHDIDMRKFLFDSLCDFIRKIDDCRRMRAAVGVFKCPAFRAFALTVPVVLRNVHKTRRRLAAQFFEHILYGLLCHLIVCKAELAVLKIPFPVDFRKPFGVVFEIFLRRDYLVK